MSKGESIAMGTPVMEVVGQEPPKAVMGGPVSKGGGVRAETAYSVVRKLVFWGTVVAVARLVLLAAMFGVAIYKHTDTYDHTNVSEMMKGRNERDSWVGPRGLAEYVIDILIASLIAFAMLVVYRGVRRNQDKNVQSLAALGADLQNIVTSTKKTTTEMSRLTGAAPAVLETLAAQFFKKE